MGLDHMAIKFAFLYRDVVLSYNQMCFSEMCTETTIIKKVQASPFCPPLYV